VPEDSILAAGVVVMTAAKAGLDFVGPGALSAGGFQIILKLLL